MAETIQRLDQAIRSNPYVRRWPVWCETDKDRVVLRGRVASYFQKQMAQESLRHLVGPLRIDNQIEVAPAGQSEGHSDGVPVADFPSGQFPVS